MTAVAGNTQSIGGTFPARTRKSSADPSCTYPQRARHVQDVTSRMTMKLNRISTRNISSGICPTLSLSLFTIAVLSAIYCHLSTLYCSTLSFVTSSTGTVMKRSTSCPLSSA